MSNPNDHAVALTGEQVEAVKLYAALYRLAAGTATMADVELAGVDAGVLDSSDGIADDLYERADDIADSIMDALVEAVA